MDKTTKTWIDYFLNGAAAKSTEQWAPNKASVKAMFNELPEFDERHTALKEATVIFFDVQESRFEQGESEVAILLYDPATECAGWWTGSLSNAFVQDSPKHRYELTYEKLESIGLKDRSKWAELLGKKIPVWVAEVLTKSGSKFYAVKSIGANKRKVQKSLDMSIIFGAKPAQTYNNNQPFTPPAMPAAAPITPTAPAADNSGIPADNPFQN